MMSVSKFISPHLASATYKGVESLEAISKEVGIPVSKLVKLNANENVYGAPKKALEALQTADHSVYPDPTQSKLREALAKLHSTHGVKPQNVVAGAGSDDILDVILRTVCPSAVVTSTPTFGMYSFLANVAGIKIVNVPRLPDFKVDVDAVSSAIKENKATVCFLASPNNPTGTILPNSDIEKLLKEDCLICVDEAYADFCDFTALDLFQKHENLVICRTFSKWSGLAGLRLGYGIAYPEIISTMMAIKQPYNVNTAAEAAGLVALEHRESIMVTVNALRSEKDRMYDCIKQEISWLEPVPSDANFVLLKVTGGLSAHKVYEELRRAGIIIRYFGSQGGDLSSFIRISAGKPSDTDAVLSELKKIGSKYFKLSDKAKTAAAEAIIFDMDGVLADVTLSQHVAIIKTAALYGVTIGEEDIGRVKARGNANNDWQVTVDLINETNHSPPAQLDKVTEQWEAIYQGTDNQAGLWECEDLLVSKPMLKAVAKKIPVAVVTGRPRLDAERFLKQHGIEDCVKLMVCLGEAASKPDPAGVLLAMKKLNITKAVFVGDTVDDIRAAVGAGICPLGVPPPTADTEETRNLLKKEGSEQVLSIGLHELNCLL
eukprot:m.20251 g.20251  ORF g.20251 m.20251 type:complete len:603 (-) comp6786_c0_seq2:959-2767(-)